MENNLDKLFKSKLGGQEPEFHPAAWGEMERLLDEEGMVPIQKLKKKRSGIFYWTLLCLGVLFSVVGYQALTSDDTNGKGSTIVENAQPLSESGQEDNLAKSSSTTTTQSNTPPSKIDQTSETGTQKLGEDQNIELNQSVNLNTSVDTYQKLRNSYADTKTKADQFTDSELSGHNVTKSPQSENKNGIAESSISTYGSTFSAQQIAKANNIDISESIASNETPNEIAESSTSLQDKLDNLEPEAVVPSPMQERVELDAVPIFESKSGLLAIAEKLISPQINILKPSRFELGLQSSVRMKDGLGFSFGPYLSYEIGGGYALRVGGQFDSQNFGNGPEMKIYDKVYSFGSELFERKFTLSNQFSMRMPVTLHKSFSGFGLTTGVILNKVLATKGSTPDEEDPFGEMGESYFIDSEMVRPLTIAFQFGATIKMSRHFDMDFGIEYRPSAFTSDPLISNDFATYYPSVGLRYKLFKF